MVITVIEFTSTPQADSCNSVLLRVVRDGHEFPPRCGLIAGDVKEWKEKMIEDIKNAPMTEAPE